MDHLRLVDNPYHVQTSDDSSILGCLTLGIIEVGGDSDHSVSDLEEDTGGGVKDQDNWYD